MASKYKTLVSFYSAFVKFCIYMIFRFCRLCVGVCNIIVHKLGGDNGQSTESKAQSGRILWRHKWMGLELSAEALHSDFLCFFNSRVNTDYVLRPNVSLYAITSKDAYFVETDGTIDIYNSNVHPFFYVAQFLFARNVIKMSITEFVALAERIGDPKVPVIWVSNTGRCGGTMLCQLFETVPGTLLIHEPHSPLNLSHLQENRALNSTQYETVLKSIIRVICKPREGVKSFCVKHDVLCTIMMKDIARLLPNIRQIYIYRNSLKTINSWLIVMESEPFLMVMKSFANTDWFSNVFPYFRCIERNYFISILKTFKETFVPTDANTACVFAYMWSLCMHIARDAIARDRSIISVKYEDIIARPMENVRQLFENLDIDVIHVDGAVNSMKRDSQRDSVVGRDRLASSEYLSSVDRIKIDSILLKFNLPLLSEDFRI